MQIQERYTFIFCFAAALFYLDVSSAYVPNTLFSKDNAPVQILLLINLSHILLHAFKYFKSTFIYDSDS